MIGGSRIPTGFQEGTERRWIAPLLMMAVSMLGCQEVREGGDRGTPSEVATAWANVGEARALANAQGESVRIGVVAGAPEHQFVRINTARLVGDTVAILDSGAREVRLFTRGGRFVRTIGRYGEGPEEFLVPTGLGVAGDTIVVSPTRPSASWAGWVKRYPRPGQEIEQWFVVTDEGALVGSVEVPAGTRLVDADQRSLLAVVRDEADVQYLQVIPLRER